VSSAIAVDLPEPAECPCGHDLVSGEYMCINGLIYGPCPDPNCGGVCEGEAGYCTHPDCACART
jgi:hypothetical protein